MKKLLIFDVDGTLVDSLRISYDVDSRIIRELGGEVPDFKNYRKNLGEKDWSEFYSGFSVKDTALALSLYYNRVNRRKYRAIPGVKELLQKLADRPIAKTVISINESSSCVISKLRAAGLKNYFSTDSVHCGRDNKIRAIREEYTKRNICPQDVLFVGDTAKDVREARAAGVRVAAISNKFSYNPEYLITQANPDYLFTDISEIASLLGDKDESN